MPEVGIIAHGAKDRPNPVGITAVRVLSVETDGITSKGWTPSTALQSWTQSPYYPAYDRVGDASVPEWVDRLMSGYF